MKAHLPIFSLPFLRERRPLRHAKVLDCVSIEIHDVLGIGLDLSTSYG
jgi:hypothetical protein